MLVHGFVTASRVNGPGLRAVIYVQGCTLRCRSCWNPETHAFDGEESSIAEATDMVQCAHHEYGLEGVTFSGGEPMQQAGELLALIETIRDHLPVLSFGMYSGYSERELESGGYWCKGELRRAAKRQTWRRIKRQLDFAVLGRYVAGHRSTLPLRTSANQQLRLFSSRYCEQDFTPQEVEIHIESQGLVHVTGFPVTGLPI